MKLKQLFIGLAFIPTFLVGCYHLETKNLKKSPDLTQREPDKILPLFQNQKPSLPNQTATNQRHLELGQPKFIKNKDFSNLKKHVEKQWALKNISILEAWKILENKPEKKPIVVAVIDTGIHKQHPCLKNNLWVNKKEIPNNNRDDDGNGFVDDVHGWNFVNNNNDIQDYHGHGTHVSGIIAAQGRSTQSPDCKVWGVLPYDHIRIMTLKYFDQNGSNSDNIKNTVSSIEYAVKNGADIINYSGGGPGYNSEEHGAIAKASDKSIIFVAALGNDGLGVKGKDCLDVKGKKVLSKKCFETNQKISYYPASYELPNILFIQSLNEQNDVIGSSNRIKQKPLERKIMQTAPGHEIISTLPPLKYIQGNFSPQDIRALASRHSSDNNYGRMTGTSQATAVVTGAVALVKSLYPSWSMRRIINQIARTGVNPSAEKIKKVTKEGKKLDAHQALIMRDSSLDPEDQKIANPNVSVKHSSEKNDTINLEPEKPTDENYKALEGLRKLFNKK